MKIVGYVCLVTAGLVLGASCTTQLELEGRGAAGEAGAQAEAGAGGEGGGTTVGGSASGSAGTPAAGAAGAFEGGAPSGGGEGGAPAQVGAAGDGGSGPVVLSILEYEDDFNAVGNWVLEANPDTEIATAEIAKGRLFVNADQYDNCPSASAKLELPELLTPVGTTTIWKLQLVEVSGAAAGRAPLVLNREPRQVTIDLMTIGNEQSGELIVTSSPAGVTITFDGAPPQWVDFSVSQPAWPPSIELTTNACGVDLLALAAVGVTRLEVISVPGVP